MKKTLLLSAFAVTAITASAQIPNAGFENWTTTGSYSVPDNWGTLNPVTTMASVYTAEKGTPGAVGSSFLKLTSRTVTGLGVVPGVAATGTINVATMQATGGFPCATRPASLTGSWQYMAMSSADQGQIGVFLTKWNTGTMRRDTVAKMVKALPGMAMNWATFSIPITYSSNSTPDSAMIILSSSNTTPADGSYLWVDNLAFFGTVPLGVSATQASVADALLFPNPAKGRVMLSWTSKINATYQVQVSDIAGHIVRQSTMQATIGDNRYPMEVQALLPGLYYVRISNDAEQTTLKLMIR